MGGGWVEAKRSGSGSGERRPGEGRKCGGEGMEETRIRPWIGAHERVDFDAAKFMQNDARRAQRGWMQPSGSPDSVVAERFVL